MTDSYPNGNGKLIVLEGIDFAGKTTQAVRLGQALMEYGYSVGLFSYPGNRAVGKLVRKLLEHGKPEADPVLLSFLFAADRAEYRHLLKQALQNNQVVIADRYLLSNVVYGMEQGLDRDWLISLDARAVQPDFTVLLNLEGDAESLRMTHLARRGNSVTRSADQYERDYRLLARCRNRYLDLYFDDQQRRRLFGADGVMVSALDGPDIVHQHIKQHVLRYLEQHGITTQTGDQSGSGRSLSRL